MQSFITSKNVQWPRLIWPTLYIGLYNTRDMSGIPVANTIHTVTIQWHVQIKMPMVRRPIGLE